MLLGFLTVKASTSTTADEQPITINSGENNKPNYWLWGFGLLALVIGGWLLYKAYYPTPQTPQERQAIVNEAAAWYAAHPIIVGGQKIEAFKKGDDDGGGDFNDEDLPDFNPEEQQKLLNQMSQYFAFSSMHCDQATQGGNKKAACRPIAEFMNAAHDIIQYKLHPVLKFGAHVGYCIQLNTFPCCDIEDLKKAGLKCACGQGNGPAGQPVHDPFRAFSNN